MVGHQRIDARCGTGPQSAAPRGGRRSWVFPSLLKPVISIIPAAESIILINSRALSASASRPPCSTPQVATCSIFGVDEFLQCSEAMKTSLVVLCAGEGIKDGRFIGRSRFWRRGPGHLPLVSYR